MTATFIHIAVAIGLGGAGLVLLVACALKAVELL